MALLEWLGLTGNDQGQGPQDPGPQAGGGIMDSVGGMFMPASMRGFAQELPQEQQDALQRQMMTQSLMSLGAGLLSAAGPHTDPRKASLGYGLSQGVQGMQQAQNQVAQNFMAGQQAQAQMAEQRRKQRMNEQFGNFLFGGGAPGGGGQAQQPPTSPTMPAGRGPGQAPTPGGGRGLATEQEINRRALELEGGPTKEAAATADAAMKRRQELMGGRGSLAQADPEQDPVVQQQTSALQQRFPGVSREQLMAAYFMGPEKGMKYIAESMKEGREAPETRSYKTLGEDGEVLKVWEQWDPEKRSWESVSSAPADQYAPPEIVRLLDEYQRVADEEGKDSFRAKSLRSRIKSMGEKSGMTMFDPETGNLLYTTDPVQQAIAAGSESKRAGMLQKMTSNKIRAINTIRQGNKLIKALSGPEAESLVGQAGRFQRFLDSMVSQVAGLRQTITDDRVSSEGTVVDKISPSVEWGDAARSQAIQSRMKYFAYDLITGLQGSRPSDRDLQMAMDMIAQNSGSPEQIRMAMASLMDLYANNFATEYREKTNRDLEWNETLQRHGIDYQIGSGDVQQMAPDDQAGGQQQQGGPGSREPANPRRTPQGEPLPEGIPDNSTFRGTIERNGEPVRIYEAPNGDLYEMEASE